MTEEVDEFENNCKYIKKEHQAAKF